MGLVLGVVSKCCATKSVAQPPARADTAQLEGISRRKVSIKPKRGCANINMNCVHTDVNERIR